MPRERPHDTPHDTPLDGSNVSPRALPSIAPRGRAASPTSDAARRGRVGLPERVGHPERVAHVCGGSAITAAAASLALAPHSPTHKALSLAERYERLHTRAALADTPSAESSRLASPTPRWAQLQAARRVASSRETPIATWRVLGPTPALPLPPPPAKLTPRAQALARMLDDAMETATPS